MINHKVCPKLSKPHVTCFGVDLDTTDGDRHAQVCSSGQDEVFDHEVDSPRPVRVTPGKTTSISDIGKQGNAPADVQTVQLPAPSTPLHPPTPVLATPTTSLQPSALVPLTTGKNDLLKYTFLYLICAQLQYQRAV